MSQISKGVCILERRGLHVAGVFSEIGLYATSIPRSTKKEALSAVNGFDLKQTESTDQIAILESIFDMMEGTQIDLKSIVFDFSDLTPKQIKVLKTLMKVPYGKTITYGELAAKAGFPGASRFVGNVMATNRFAPLIPCHRVLSSSGYGGYGFGLETKISLLHKEGAI